MRKRALFAALGNVLALCVVVFAVSAFFVYNDGLIGFVLFVLGFVCIGSLALVRVPIATLGPDIVFGIIDNGILAVMAIFGGRIAGVAGAIAGGVVGNAITDGIAGVFEGYYAEARVTDRRTLLGSAVGKMSGCLLGAGGVLMVAGFF